MGGGDGEIKETEAQVEAQKVAIDQYNLYMEEYRPFEKKFIADVTGPTAGREAKAAGRVNADIAQKTAVPAGADPNRVLGSPALATEKAAIEARAVNEAKQAVRDQRVKGMQAVSDIGMGKESEAKLGFEDLATDSLREAVADKKADIQVSNAVGSGIMSAVGAGAGIYANAGRGAIKDRRLAIEDRRFVDNMSDSYAGQGKWRGGE